jgi:hypothetical protein
VRFAFALNNTPASVLNQNFDSRIVHCSMQQSCLLCISTLLESGNHYSKMFELRDSIGRQLFETISISLVCDDCMKTDNPGM